MRLRYGLAPGKAGPSAVWECCPGTEGAECLHVCAATVASCVLACSRRNSGALSPWDVHMPFGGGVAVSVRLVCINVYLPFAPPLPSVVPLVTAKIPTSPNPDLDPAGDIAEAAATLAPVVTPFSTAQLAG